jgi:polar amino acid transport system substrate-binding protein
MKNSVAAGIIVILAIAAIGGYYYYSVQKPAEKKMLVVGTNTPFPPFEYVDENGAVTGFDIEVIRALAQRAGYDDIEVKDMAFDSLITALQQGQIDAIAAGMTITPERQGQVGFTDPYWEADQSILVLQDSFNPQGTADLAGKVVGVQTGTTGAMLAEENNATLGEIKYYDTFLLAVLDLQNGRIDAVIVDSPVAVAFTKQYQVHVASTITTGEQWGFAVRKEDMALQSSLNAALREFKGSPEWEELIVKYFGT